MSGRISFPSQFSRQTQNSLRQDKLEAECEHFGEKTSLFHLLKNIILFSYYLFIFHNGSFRSLLLFLLKKCGLYNYPWFLA